MDQLHADLCDPPLTVAKIESASNTSYDALVELFRGFLSFLYPDDPNAPLHLTHTFPHEQCSQQLQTSLHETLVTVLEELRLLQSAAGTLAKMTALAMMRHENKVLAYVNPDGNCCVSVKLPFLYPFLSCSPNLSQPLPRSACFSPADVSNCDCYASGCSSGTSSGSCFSRQVPRAPGVLV